MRVELLTVIGLVACGKVSNTDVDAQQADAFDGPVIVSVSTPTSLEAEGAMATIMASVHGHPNEVLKVSFSGMLGTYGPPTSLVTTDAAGNGTVSTTFISGMLGGVEAGVVTASNAAMVNSVPKQFGFQVIALARYGQATAFGASGQFGQDNLLGQTITVTAAGTLKKIGFISISAGPMIKVGIYADAGGVPATLLTQIPATNVAMGTNEIALASPLAMNAGTYWFMAVYNTQGNVGSDQTAARTIRFIAEPFANPLPTVFPTMTSTNMSGNFNYYLVFGP